MPVTAHSIHVTWTDGSTSTYLYDTSVAPVTGEKCYTFTGKAKGSSDPNHVISVTIASTRTIEVFP